MVGQKSGAVFQVFDSLTTYALKILWDKFIAAVLNPSIECLAFDMPINNLADIMI